MPIVRSSYAGPDGLLGIKAKGDKLIFNHLQRVDDIALACKEKRKDPSRGYSKDKQYRHFASIPELVFFAHPEFVQPDGRLNMPEVEKWLDSQEGEMFKTVEGSARHA